MPEQALHNPIYRGRAFLLGYAGFCAVAFALALRPPVADFPAPSSSSFVIADMTGKLVRLAGIPHRILFASNIMPAFVTLAQSTDRIVAATKLGKSGMTGGLLDRIYPGADDLPLAGMNTALDPEAILRFQPDAIFGGANQTTSAVIVGFPRYLIFTSNISIDTHLMIWRLLGKLAGQDERAASLQTRGQRMLHDVTETVAKENYKSNVLIAVSGTNSIHVVGAGHMLTPRLQLAGAVNAARAPISLLDVEAVARINPDAILISTFFSNLVPEDFYRQKMWTIVRAVREHKVYLAPDFPIFTSAVFDPLLVDWMAELLHPEIMPHRMRDTIRDAYRDVYDYNASETEIDRLLNMDANDRSANYTRFMAIR